MIGTFRFAYTSSQVKAQRLSVTLTTSAIVPLVYHLEWVQVTTQIYFAAFPSFCSPVEFKQPT